MSYEKLGFTSGQVLTADHMNHIEDGIANASANSGGVTSWNDLTDKPFYGGEKVLLMNNYTVSNGTELTVPYSIAYDGVVEFTWDYTDFYEHQYQFGFGGSNILTLGNSYLEDPINWDSGEPYYITFTKENGNTTIKFLVKDSFEHIVSLYATEEIKSIDSKYLPEYLSGGVSWESIKNRPFYGGEETLLTQGCPVTNGTVINIYENIPDRCTITIGWDSTLYEFNYDYDSRTSFGNASLVNWYFEDTGEPFFVSINRDIGEISFKVNDNEQHYVNINAVSEIKKIDDMYIPDTVARKSDIQASGGGASDVCVLTIRPVDFGSEGGEYTCDKTHAELVAAWQAGIPVIVVRNMGAYHGVLKSIQWAGLMSESTEVPFIIPADEQGMYSFYLFSDNRFVYMSNE